MPQGRNVGHRRLRVRSDWPVVEGGGGLARWQDATDVLLGSLPTAARAEIRGGTARRFYGLD